jgi:hypothetical protein
MKPADADDAKVDAEWRRLEHERIAQERAEAGEDIEAAAAEQPKHGLPAWQLIAMAVALLGGVFMTLFLNRIQPVASRSDPSHERSPQ